jgi:hypothetical protein
MTVNTLQLHVLQIAAEGKMQWFLMLHTQNVKTITNTVPDGDATFCLQNSSWIDLVCKN